MLAHTNTIENYDESVTSSEALMEERYKIKLRNLIRKIKKYNSVFDVALLKKAYGFSYDAHREQLRRSGDPYFEHPCNVADILADLKMDLITICGALLHDVAKPTQRIRDEDGIDHFYGHEIKGVKMVEKELRYLKYSLHTIGYVKEATRYHMTRIMFVHEMKDATIRRLMGRLKYISIRDLLRLQIADMRGNLREPYSLDEQIKLLRYVLKRIRKIEKESHVSGLTDIDKCCLPIGKG